MSLQIPQTIVGLLGKILFQVVLLVLLVIVIRVVVYDEPLFVADHNRGVSDSNVLDIEEEVNFVEDAFHLIV